MFHRLHAPPETVTVSLDGEPLAAVPGETVAAAMLSAGATAFCTSPQRDAPRGPYCMIGHCYACLVEIDGTPYRQACLTQVAAGMHIRRMITHGL